MFWLIRLSHLCLCVGVTNNMRIAYVCIIISVRIYQLVLGQLVDTDERKLDVKLAGMSFIVDNRLDRSSSEWGKANYDCNVSLIARKSVKFQKEGVIGVVSCGDVFDNIHWEREISFSDTNRTMEINYAIDIPPNDYGQERRFTRLKFYVPVKVLSGCDFSYRYGMHRSGRPMKHGHLTGKEQEGRLIAGHIRHIQFTGKVNVYIDFCPVGVWGLYNYDPSSAYKAHLLREGDNYVFILPNHRTEFGAKCLNKIIVKEGVYDMDEIHLIKRLHYSDPMPALTRIQFTEKKLIKGFAIHPKYVGWNVNFKKWGKGLYCKESGMGWVKKPTGKIVYLECNKDMGNLLSNGFLGKGHAIFRIRHPNALVLVNLIFSGLDKPYDVDVAIGQRNNMNTRKSVRSHQRRTVIVPFYVKNNQLNIRISGKQWLLNGIVVQFLLGRQEDYQFSRNWWVANSDLCRLRKK